MKFLFDLGGVFFDWNPKYFFKNVFADSKEMNFFLTNVCNDTWNLKQDAGRSIQEAEKEIISKFPNYKEKIQMYYSNHRKMIKSTFIDSISILNTLKKNGYLCYVLSNWSAETFKGMENDYPFLNNFDDMLISGKENLIKPDIAIYQLAIKRFNLIPEKTVFIDDKLENTQAAEELGFNVIHLTNPLKIINEIEKFLI